MSSSALVGTWFVGGRSVLGPDPGHSARFRSVQPQSANWCVLPRCTVEFEKTSNGCKIHCRCDDEVARGTLQNLCRMLADGLCSCCCTCNGIPCCQCNFTVGICKCEYTKDGCCISCTSRRQGLPCDDSGLLQLPQHLLRIGLLLLHLLQQHAGLLRHLRVIVCKPKTNAPADSTAKPSKSPGHFRFTVNSGRAEASRCSTIAYSVRFVSRCAWVPVALDCPSSCFINCLA